MIGEQEIEERRVGIAQKDNEALYRLIVETANEGIWIYDSDNLTVFVNQRLADMLGYNREEMIGKKIFDFMGEDTARTARMNYGKRLKCKNNRYEQKYYKKDGTLVWASISASPLRDNNQKTVAVLGMLTDITKNKATEDAFRNEHKKLLAIVDNMGVGVGVADPFGTILTLNKAALELHGFKTEEEMFSRLNFYNEEFELQYPDGRLMPVDEWPISRAIKGEYVHDYELYLIQKSNRLTKYVSYNVVPIFDNQDKLSNIVFNITDFTETKSINAALSESQQRYDYLFNNNTLGIAHCKVIVNDEGKPVDYRMLQVNNAYTKITGTQKHDVEGKTIKEIFPGIENSSFDYINKYGKIALEGGELNVENYFEVYNKWFSVYVYCPKYGEFTSMFTDITYRKEWEEKLRKTENELREAQRISRLSSWSWERQHQQDAGFLEQVCVFESEPDKSGIFYNPDSWKQINIAIQNSLETGESFEMDIEAFRDKNPLWLTLRGEAVINEENRIWGLRGTIQDITERKNIENALAQERELFQGIFDNIPVMITIYDPKLKGFRFNEVFKELTGWTEQDSLEGDFIAKIYPDPQYRLCVLEFMQSLKSGWSDFQLTTKMGDLLDSSWASIQLSSGLQIGIGIDTRELRKTEAELRESEQRFRTLADNISQFAWIADSEGKVYWYNQRWYDYTGLTPEDMVNYDRTKLNHPDYIDKIINTFNNALKTGKPWEETYPIKSKHGIFHWFLARALPIKDEHGNITQWFGTHTDITDLRNAELALRKNEQRLRGIFNNAAMGIVEVDKNERFIDVNDRLLEMLGYSREELLSKTIHELTYEQDKGFTITLYDKIHDGESDIIDYEKRYVKKDGELIWVHVSVSAIRNEQGKIMSSIGIIKNITERKKYEQAVHESEEQFRSLFENITEGVALHELIYENNQPVNYRILQVNPAFKEHTGIEPEKAFGKLATELYKTPEAPYIKEYAQVVETGQPIHFELFFPPLGKYFVVSAISYKTDQFATVIEDITEQKNKENEIKQKNEELTRFIYTVSHDLKSPLVTIKSFTSYLKEDIELGEKESQDKDIGYIENAADKMGKLLDELLELSRVGRKEEPKTEILFQNIAQNAIDLVAGRISERNAQVFVSAPPIMIYGHMQRLIQLFQNLIDNAVKFTSNQQVPQIEIGAFMDKNRQNELVMFVKDNGIGIDPRYHHKIFGLFEKLDNTSEGTGIGLALIKRIVEVHGGNIWFASEGTGTGTIFYFTLKGARIINN